MEEIVKTIGGNRLGSGDKMKVALHNYERSTHDLGNTWRSSMAPGVLVPFYKKICPKADTWTIDLNELVRTIPAIGPLFGQYKLQLDMFEIPIRLYNGILHNNMTKIGMEMKKVKLPKIKMKTITKGRDYVTSENEYRQISTSALIRYLGQKGIMGCKSLEKNDTIVERNINAVPILAYYDIFKNYYANKQEEYAYIIDNNSTEISTLGADTMTIYQLTPTSRERNLAVRPVMYSYDNAGVPNQIDYIFDNENEPGLITITLQNNNTLLLIDNSQYQLKLQGINYVQNTRTKFNGGIYSLANAKLLLYDRSTDNYVAIQNKTPNHGTILDIRTGNIDGTSYLYASWNGLRIMQACDDLLSWWDVTSSPTNIEVKGLILDASYEIKSEVTLKKFKLENIDKARIDILRNTELNHTVYIDEDGEEINYLPYTSICETDDSNYTKSKYPMQGMVVKTYQSDYFNNWLSSDWIDGLNGISQITNVDVSGGTLNIDALNLKQKVYNLLNRVAISGGSYEDWQEAVSGEEALRRAESPIYCGGAAGIIAFEEVVSTADTNTASAGDQPLGTIAGKGTLLNTKGGHIEIKINEPSYIMGIASITPYIDYSQGNDFDMTEIDSLDDLHKPALDGIGFQDLLLERAAWWATEYDVQNDTIIKHAGGKLPAWIDYMTSVNEVHGDFADMDKLGYMVLNRHYEIGNGNDNNSLLNQNAPARIIPIADWTTYINPSKYNYQFADTNLTSQNFWVQIQINAISRRKMSAKIIPNI